MGKKFDEVLDRVLSGPVGIILTIIVMLIFLAIVGQACVPTFGGPW